MKNIIFGLSVLAAGCALAFERSGYRRGQEL